MDIESLVIKVGVDTQSLNTGLANIRGGLTRMQSGVQQFGRRMTDSMQQGERGIGKINSSLDTLKSKVQSTGDSFVQAFRGMAMQIAAPILGMLSLSSAVSGYISDVQKVAEQTGAYNKQLEEERRKKELLARVTKEDIDRYVKYQYAMHKFQDSVRSVSNAFIRTFGPAIDKAVQYLEKWANWVRANENNIVRFLKVVASIIMVALIPAFVRLAAVMLANPITWLVLLLAGLAFVIEDLIVYMNGGQSAFEDLWKQFGTG